MSVADKNLCQELFKLSGWDDTDWLWVGWSSSEPPNFIWKPTHVTQYGWYDLPYEKQESMQAEKRVFTAYDTDYLLGRLPQTVILEKRALLRKDPQDYVAHYPLQKNCLKIRDTAANALVELAIELFKQGVLQHD